MSLLLARSASPPRLVLRRLDRLGLLAGIVQLGCALSLEQHWKRTGVFEPVEGSRLALVDRAAVQGLGIGLPLLVHGLQALTGRHSRGLSVLAGLATLAGAYLERAVVVFAGNRSADRPEDHFRVSQADGRA
jgi:hypothetical protein